MSIKDVEMRVGFTMNGNNRNLLTDREKYIVYILKQHGNLITTIEQQMHFSIFKF